MEKKARFTESTSWPCVGNEKATIAKNEASQTHLLCCCHGRTSTRAGESYDIVEALENSNGEQRKYCEERSRLNDQPISRG